jgi:hypothetical protein
VIVNALLSFFASALSFVLGLLPSWSPLDLGGAVSALSGITSGMLSVIDWLDWYVPAKFACGLLLGVWVYQASVYVVNFVIWALAKAHLLGGE